jgi:hypothetical protein
MVMLLPRGQGKIYSDGIIGTFEKKKNCYGEDME